MDSPDSIKPEAGVPTHALLWHQCQDVVEKCLEHPFLQRMATGDLPSDAYDRYIAQDVIFLEGYVGAIGTALGRGYSANLTAFLSASRPKALEELDQKINEAEKRGILRDLIKPHPATVRFVSFLTETAQTANGFLAALTPCVRLYAYLGQELSKRVLNARDNEYNGWISRYASSDMEKVAKEWEDLLSEVALPTEEVKSAYRTALEHEVALFEAVYSGE